MAAGNNKIQEILALARKRLKGKEKDNLLSLIPNYWAMIAYEDLHRDPESLLDIARKHMALAASRKPGEIKIACSTPRDSEVLIVEIICDDMPFLFDSSSNALHRLAYSIALANHPVVWAKRNGQGRLQALAETEPESSADPQWCAEAMIRFELEVPAAHVNARHLEKALRKVINDVAVVVQSWQLLRGKAAEIRFGLERPHLPVDECERSQLCSFLEWVEDNNFTFISYIYANIKKERNSGRNLEPNPRSRLGLKIDASPWNNLAESSSASSLLDDYLDSPSLLVITKANDLSPVHRDAHLDYIAIKDFDRQGQLKGEHRFFGLFTRSAYNSRALDIPLLATRIREARNRAHFPDGSHNAKMLLQILETFPRDDLFQQNAAELYATAMGVLAIDERNRVRVFPRLDPFLRYFSLLIYLPRDRYSQIVREQIQSLISRHCGTTNMTFNIQFNESSLARLHLIVRLKDDSSRKLDGDSLEQEIDLISRDWREDFRQHLLRHCGRKHATGLYDAYRNAFSAAYRAKTTAEAAARDILELERLSQSHDALTVRLMADDMVDGNRVQIRGYYSHHPVALAEAQPRLANLGLRLQTEDLYPLQRADGSRFWIQDFRAESTVAKPETAVAAATRFEEAFLQIERGNCEDDWFNQLLLVTRLDWREVGTLRAYSRYLKQLGFRFGRIYISETLTRHAAVTEKLMSLFEAKFKPQVTNRARKIAEIDGELLEALDEVTSLDADRILRSFRNVIQATLRCNFYCNDDDSQTATWCFKLSTRDIPEAPLPRPMFEIWVHSPRFEAVHLRNGMVARGGLRWSDRPEDFRTEVLGLVKAQIVKNAVIVPVGAKGGFVCRRDMATWDRAAVQKEVISCYRSFMGAMLRITDNLDGDTVVPPKQVVRHDGDDPYLVVAADKGTATFSDIANEVAGDHGFWIGDAFASGGSNGYDHKKMGITASGAWESVKRHFREFGQNIQREAFTVVGVGDMGGDVFGNGMLLSKHIKLVAAFNHRHIFLDPNPDTAVSFKERKRLFRHKVSGWDGYNKDLLSKGGAVFLRSDKSIKPSAQICQALDIETRSYTPDELIAQILKAPVDLFWNGGIGTYVKASGESHEQVGDRANDSLRINGNELRCKVIGEGGNLGLTQLGRVEYNQSGGRCITDFIDNSGGVDSSDMEVNIKILLNAVMAAGKLDTGARNTLLKSMTADVKESVLRDNYLQALAIGMISVNASERLGEHAELIRILERDAGLDRRLEYLPDEKSLQQRRTSGQGLTRPEIAILVSYSKIDLYNALLASDVPEDPYLSRELIRYFPAVLQERFADFLPKHRLRREIISTRITNSLINRMGAAFTHRLSDEMGVGLGQIARAYTIARDAFGIPEIWRQIDALDNRVPDRLQLQMTLETRRLIKHITLWLVQSDQALDDIESMVTQLGQCAEQLRSQLGKLLADKDAQQGLNKSEQWQSEGVPKELSDRLSQFKSLHIVPDLWWLQSELKAPEASVSKAYMGIANLLDISWIRHSIESLKADSRWEALARVALIDDLFLGQRRLVTRVYLAIGSEAANPAALDKYFAPVDQYHYFQTLRRELQSSATPDYLSLSVLLRQLGRLGH